MDLTQPPTQALTLTRRAAMVAMLPCAVSWPPSSGAPLVVCPVSAAGAGVAVAVSAPLPAAGAGCSVTVAGAVSVRLLTYWVI